MKAAQIIIQHLLNQKMVTLQHIGTFFLASEIPPPDPEKGLIFPEGSISFTYDEKSKEDDSLVQFIMEQTRKIRPLASSDLDSYLNLGCQFLNLGKPFVLEGLGTLQKDSSGIIQFFQGGSVPGKSDFVAGPELREKANEDISFAAPSPKKNNWTIWLTFIIIFAGLIVSAIYYFSKNNEKEIKIPVLVTVKSSAPVKESTPTAAPSIVSKDTAVQPAAVLTPTSNNFRIVLKEFPYNYNKALEYYNKYKSTYTLRLYTDDTTIYKVAILFNAPLSDTTRVKDSLTRILHGMKLKVDISKN